MNAHPPYQWLLFDADGTLFDFEIAEAKALEATFQDFHLPFSDATGQAYQTINHQIWQDFEKGKITSEALRTARFERLFETAQIVQEAGPFSDRYLRNLSAVADLLPGAEVVVRELARRYRLAIITNGLKDVQRPRLAGSGIADCFEVVAISEELGVAKPDPRFFDAAFAMMGQPARETALVIGDSLSSDILGGMNYSLDTCWYNPADKAAGERFRIRYQIRRLEELLDLLPG